jgi:hypothetical protein
MLLLLLAPLALANAPLTVDLDGDGKPETITVDDRGVRVGKHLIECGGEALCAVQVHDLSSEDKVKELVTVDTGPRDDKHARVYRLEKSGPVELGWSQPETWVEAVHTTGSGILLTDSRERLYVKREKWVLKGGVLTLVPQPFWAVAMEVGIDRSAPIHRSIQGAEVVATIRAGSRIELLLESADSPGWFLVKISSGLTGWIELEALRGASDEVMGIYSAG